MSTHLAWPLPGALAAASSSATSGCGRSDRALLGMASPAARAARRGPEPGAASLPLGAGNTCPVHKPCPRATAEEGGVPCMPVLGRKSGGISDIHGGPGSPSGSRSPPAPPSWLLRPERLSPFPGRQGGHSPTRLRSSRAAFFCPIQATPRVGLHIHTLGGLGSQHSFPVREGSDAHSPPGKTGEIVLRGEPGPPEVEREQVTSPATLPLGDSGKHSCHS